MIPYALVLAAYLLGSIPSSHWMGKGIFGVDLREKGSGNLGSTNAFRVLGAKAALPVVILDIGKGWLPVWLFPQLDGAAWSWSLAYAAAAILGHVFSVFLRFRGGKGVATSAGGFLALAPGPLLGGLVVWVVLTVTTRIVSVASMSAVLAVLAAVWLLQPSEGEPGLLAFTAGLAAFVLWAHRTNIVRLARGEENRFGDDDEDAPSGGASEAGAEAGTGTREART